MVEKNLGERSPVDLSPPVPSVVRASALASGVKAVSALVTRLEQATEGSRELDAEIYLAIGEIDPAKQHSWNAPVPLDVYALEAVRWHGHQYTRNLAAAVSLVPGWYWRVGHGTERPGWAHLNKRHPDHCDRGDEITAYAPTPELALCIAALKARSHGETARRDAPRDTPPTARAGGPGHADARDHAASTDARSPNPSIPAGSVEESKTP